MTLKDYYFAYITARLCRHEVQTRNVQYMLVQLPTCCSTPHALAVIPVTF